MECGIHGKAVMTFICQHLMENGAQTWHSLAPSSENRWPDAWCSICQVAYLRESEWNDKNEGAITVKLACHRCYETLRALGTSVSVGYETRIANVFIANLGSSLGRRVIVVQLSVCQSPARRPCQPHPRHRKSAIRFTRHARRWSTRFAHKQREEVENAFISWRSPTAIVQEFGLSDRASVYRHAHALGLFEKRQRNVRAALERIIEKAGEVDVTASAVVAAVQAYANVAAQHRIALSLGERLSQAEPHYHVPVVSTISLSRGRTKEPGSIESGAAAIRSETILFNFICAPIGWRSRIVFGITIFSPLPDIPYNVIETEWISRFQANGVRSVARIVLKPGVVSCDFVIITLPECSLSSRPRCVFPF
jgi:hypothetical protein